MKKIYTLIAAIVISLGAQAALHTVQVANFSFSPANITAVCGDSILWVWASGSHTTTSTSVPSCATSWSAPINSSIPAYGIVIACAGTYSYTCSFHPSMLGTITATCSVGIDEPQQNISTLVYPNPFNSQITLVNHHADAVRITDVTGQVVKAIALNTSGDKSEINLDALEPGMYFLTTLSEGVIRETKKIMKTK
jgi:plastocyanin